jgi:adenosine/AMP kinase
MAPPPDVRYVMMNFERLASELDLMTMRHVDCLRVSAVQPAYAPETKRIESKADKKERHEFLRKIGYER